MDKSKPARPHALSSPKDGGCSRLYVQIKHSGSEMLIDRLNWLRVFDICFLPHPRAIHVCARADHCTIPILLISRRKLKSPPTADPPHIMGSKSWASGLQSLHAPSPAKPFTLLFSAPILSLQQQMPKASCRMWREFRANTLVHGFTT